MRMSAIKFLLADGASAVFTVILMGGIGYLGGNSLQVLRKDVAKFQHLAIVAFILLLAGWIFFRSFKGRNPSPIDRGGKGGSS
jgi:membrane protein DedA with SNARE-associated domain